MGRVRSFDTDDAVRRARSVFWSVGYAQASLPELEAATGLQRSSIYHAFGSKRGLFDAAVASYLAEVVRPRLAPLSGADVAPHALTDYLTGLVRALRAPGSPAADGCLLVAAAGAPIGQEPEVREAIRAYRSELLAAFTAGAAARFPRLAAAERDRLAETCAGLVIAAFALARIDPVAAAATLEPALGAIAALDRAEAGDRAPETAAA
ncbi:TetR/AcrR family transcriptional regulator [Leucobacter luti]|uniref:TetR family transcriptional regulator n=1 Tax=Leucobacter luti TaxID=340320 RepID=A0A4V6MBZ3_9MICO|nr:helix-turn-helix domain-containing protein [Leucobacter luti]MBL3699913.1 TetR/AcrR family transcriptional regulator [Leucobacter luti]RZT62769.1 TetR family transcriptional regulator [Leucobacter luti]